MKKYFFALFVLNYTMYASAQTESAYYVPTGSSTYTGYSSTACTAMSSSLPCWYKNLEKYWYYRALRQLSRQW